MKSTTSWFTCERWIACLAIESSSSKCRTFTWRHRASISLDSSSRSPADQSFLVGTMRQAHLDVKLTLQVVPSSRHLHSPNSIWRKKLNSRTMLWTTKCSKLININKSWIKCSRIQQMASVALIWAFSHPKTLRLWIKQHANSQLRQIALQSRLKRVRSITQSSTNNACTVFLWSREALDRQIRQLSSIRKWVWMGACVTRKACFRDRITTLPAWLQTSSALSQSTSSIWIVGIRLTSPGSRLSASVDRIETISGSSACPTLITRNLARPSNKSQPGRRAISPFQMAASIQKPTFSHLLIVSKPRTIYWAQVMNLSTRSSYAITSEVWTRAWTKAPFSKIFRTSTWRSSNRIASHRDIHIKRSTQELCLKLQPSNSINRCPTTISNWQEKVLDHLVSLYSLSLNPRELCLIRREAIAVRAKSPSTKLSSNSNLSTMAEQLKDNSCNLMINLSKHTWI